MNLPSPQLLLATLCIAFAAPAEAAETSPEAAPPPQRLCTDKDIVGTYVLMDFHETTRTEESDFHMYAPHLYLAFYPDNTYSTIGINKAITSPQLLNKYLRSNGKSGPKNKTYVLGKEGALYLYTGKKIDYSYRCVANLIDNDDYKKGDLILTGYNKTHQSELYNLFRRWY